VNILEQQKQWSKVKMQYDDYEGWIDTKQLQTISESSFNQLSSEAILNADLIEYITARQSIDPNTSWIFCFFPAP
jgi:hypothetical protein